MAPKEIIQRCNSLAILFYTMHGYKVSPDYKMYEARHPDERSLWNLAQAACEHLLGDDIDEALDELENEKTINFDKGTIA